MHRDLTKVQKVCIYIIHFTKCVIFIWCLSLIKVWSHTWAIPRVICWVAGKFLHVNFCNKKQTRLKTKTFKKSLNMLLFWLLDKINMTAVVCPSLHVSCLRRFHHSPKKISLLDFPLVNKRRLNLSINNERTAKGFSLELHLLCVWFLGVVSIRGYSLWRLHDAKGMSLCRCLDDPWIFGEGLCALFHGKRVYKQKHRIWIDSGTVKWRL